MCLKDGEHRSQLRADVCLLISANENACVVSPLVHPLGVEAREVALVGRVDGPPLECSELKLLDIGCVPAVGLESRDNIHAQYPELCDHILV
jgi:hypothetical protein